MAIENTIDQTAKFVEWSTFCRIINEAAKTLGLNVEKEFVLDSLGSKKYLIKKDGDYHHEFGKGGYLNDRFILLDIKNRNILASKRRMSWNTLSDDSEDQGGICEKITALSSEDILGRLAFEKMKTAPEFEVNPYYHKI